MDAEVLPAITTDVGAVPWFGSLFYFAAAETAIASVSLATIPIMGAAISSGLLYYCPSAETAITAVAAAADYTA